MIKIFDNARTYNTPETIYYKYANQLQNLVKPMLDRLKDNPHAPLGDGHVQARSNYQPQLEDFPEEDEDMDMDNPEGKSEKSKKNKKKKK